MLDPVQCKTVRHRTWECLSSVEIAELMWSPRYLWVLGCLEQYCRQLKSSLKTQDQDEEWLISATFRPISIHVARSARGSQLYVPHIVVKPGDDDSSNRNSDITIVGITWEQNKGESRISEEQSKKEIVIITRGILRCDFDALPEYDVSDLWNHSAALLENRLN